MKVKTFMAQLKQLDQDADIFYCDEDETNCKLIVIENEEQNGKGEIKVYYTIEKN